jgi:hypothetical protein
LKSTCKPAPIFFLALAAFACLAMPGLGSSLPVASINATVTGCTTNPCSGNFSQSGTESGSLSTFGDSYNLTSFIPSLQETGVSTPGKLEDGLGSSVTALGFPSPTLSAVVKGSTGGGASAQLDYYFEVVPIGGGSTPAAVEVGIAAVGSTSSSTAGALQSGNTTVQLVLSGAAGTGVDDEANVFYGVSCSITCSTFDSSSTLGSGFVSTPGVGDAVIAESGSLMTGGFNESGTYSEFTNTVYKVALVENIQSAGSGGSSASASIDPIITVPLGFELELSAGVGNASAVPEPQTWAVLAAGIAVLIAAKRRKASRASRACALVR